MGNLHVRMDDTLKDEATALYERMGLTLSAAVQIFFRQSLIYGAIPFEIRYSRDEVNENGYDSGSG